MAPKDPRAEEVFDYDVEEVVIDAPIGTVVGNVHPAEVGNFHAPEDLPVEGVQGHESVESLVVESSVDGKGS